MDETDRSRLANAIVGEIAAHGRDALTPARIAAAAHVSVATFNAIFANPHDWIEAAFDRALSNRIAALRVLAEGKENQRSAESCIALLGRTVLTEGYPARDIVAQYDLFFLSRDDAECTRRLQQLYAKRLPELRSAADTLFPTGISRAVRDLIHVHMETLACIAVSNGFSVFALPDKDLKILVKLLRNGALA